MRSAIDTNIISALWSGGALGREAESMLRVLNREGGLVICGPVYIELHGHPTMATARIDEFLNDSGLEVDFDLDATIWRTAAASFGEYVDRRRDSAGGQPKRMLADFVIGAHALHRADRLITLDRERYSAAFPTLRIAP